MGNTPTKAAQTGSSTAETKQDQKQTTTQTITQEAKDQLKTACYTGNIKKIEELIAQYSANILKEKLDTNGSNALIHAAVGGHNNTIDHLLSKGLSLDFTNNNGTNALIYAALNGHNNTIDHLLSKGLSLDFTNNNGTNALIYAALNGQNNTIDHLLSKGLSLDFTNNKGSNALLLAAYWGHNNTIDHLLSKGLSLDFTNNNGDNTLILAAYNGHTSTVKKLIELGIDINIKGENNKTAREWACHSYKKSDKEVVKKEIIALIDNARNIREEYLKEEKTKQQEVKQDQKQTTAPAPTPRITREEFLKSIAHYQNGNDKQKKLHQNLIKLYDNDPSLTSLNLGFNNIGDQGAQAIAEILANNTTLTSLYLRSNNIWTEGAQAIAEALANNTTLTRLGLSGSSIGDQGAQAIAEILVNNTTLTSLDLQQNNIGKEGVQAIVEALANNTTLTSLNLRDNKIGDQGAQAIAQGLANNTTLTSLDLRWNNIGKELKNQIKALIDRNEKINAELAKKAEKQEKESKETKQPEVKQDQKHRTRIPGVTEPWPVTPINPVAEESQLTLTQEEKLNLRGLMAITSGRETSLSSIISDQNQRVIRQTRKDQLLGSNQNLTSYYNSILQQAMSFYIGAMTASTGRFKFSVGSIGLGAIGASGGAEFLDFIGLLHIPGISSVASAITATDTFYKGMEFKRITNITHSQNIMLEVAEELAYQLTNKRKDSQFTEIDYSVIEGSLEKNKILETDPSIMQKISSFIEDKITKVNQFSVRKKNEILGSDNPTMQKISSFAEDRITKPERQAILDMSTIMLEMMKLDTWLLHEDENAKKPNAIRKHDHEAALTRMLQVMNIERQDQKQATSTRISTANVTLTLPGQDAPAVEAAPRSELEELREMMKQQQEEIKRLREEQLRQQQEKTKHLPSTSPGAKSNISFSADQQQQMQALIQEGKTEEAERMINGIVAFSLQDVYAQLNENRSRIDRNEEAVEYASDTADDNRSLIEESRTRGGRGR